MSDEGPSLVSERTLEQLERIATALERLALCVEMEPGEEFSDGQDRWRLRVDATTWEMNQ